MMQISSMPESMASSRMIWMTGLVMPSRSTRGNISFWTAVEAGYWREPRPAAVMTALRTRGMSVLISEMVGAAHPPEIILTLPLLEYPEREYMKMQIDPIQL